MVGIAGAIGSFTQNPSIFSDALSFFGDEVAERYTDSEIDVTTVFHPDDAESQPVLVTSTNELLWVWGDVYGYRDSGGDYLSKGEDAPSLSTAEYCAKLYERHGSKFIAGLNGSFVGLLFNEKSNLVQFFTDRLGSRPIHYYTVEDGVVFSTQIQPLCGFLEGRLTFDMEFVGEYFSFERSLGLKTPIDGVTRAHPGAITRVDIDNQLVDVDVRWRPVHNPLDESYDRFVDRFTNVFESAVIERYNPDTETGVLLSGGSDSRLLMAALPSDGITGYHINDWKNREARIAERIADVSGKSFTYLERDHEYYERAFEFSSTISNFTSWFQHGHAGGHVDRLRRDCDILMTGHYSDTLYKHNYLPYKGIKIPGTTIELPLYLERNVQSTDDLVSLYLGTKFHNRKHLRAPPDYLRINDLQTILENNINEIDGFVNHHGVLHQSPHDAGLFSECYPLTNSPGRLFFDVMLQTSSYRNPFLDVRLIELMTKLPTEYRLRKNIINSSIGKVQSELAEVPHPGTTIALTHPFILQYIALQVRWLKDQLGNDEKPKSYYRNGSWPAWDELIRQHEFLRTGLEELSPLMDKVHWIDMGRLWDHYAQHMKGEDHFDELSAMLSFISIPATQSILRSDALGTDLIDDYPPVDI